MSDETMPDEIYAWMGLQDNGSWDHKPCQCTSHDSVKYLRADLVQDMIEAAIDKYTKACNDAEDFISALPKGGHNDLR